MTSPIAHRRARTALLIVAAALIGPAGASGADRAFDVRDFGASGDGRRPDTGAINRAIAACAEAGGGRVVFPGGTYRSGTIHLKSGVTLEVGAGARVVGTDDLGAYQGFSPPGGTPEAGFDPRWHRALILGVGVDRVAIVGPGEIDGAHVFDPRGEERMRGPHTILLGNSREITIADVSIRNSANYAVMLEGCSKVDIRGLDVAAGWDGVHFRGWPGEPCRDVSITRCRFSTGDDAIAGRYWERTLIADCEINSSCNGIRLIGPATDLVVRDCRFFGPGRFEHRSSGRRDMLAAINLQPGAWDPTEGALDDVWISDVSMENVASPLHVSIKPGNTAGGIVVERLSATGVGRAACSIESWAGAPIGRVTLRDASIAFTGGGPPGEGRPGVRAPGVDVRPLPSWGLYARKVEHLALERVRLDTASPDARPALMVEDVGRLVLDDVRFPAPPGDAPPMLLRGVGRVEERRRDTPPDPRDQASPR